MEDQQIIELAKQHGFELEGTEWKLNRSGLDFLVVLFEDRSGIHWVLRIPRRQDVQTNVDKEKQILDLVEPNISIQAPKWEVVTDELIAYRALDGVPAGTIIPEEGRYEWVIDPENLSDQFVKTLAEGMVSLHAIPLEKVKEKGLPVQAIGEVKKAMQERMENVRSSFDVHEQLWARWQAWINDDSMWPEQTGFAHGDLHAGHILIGVKEEVTGFIDWTEGGVADVSIDFVGHFRAFGEKELDRLLEAYQRAGGNVWPKMKAHILELAATSPVEVAEFAIRSRLDEYMEMARDTLSKSE